MRFIALGLIALQMLAAAVLASAHNDTAWSRPECRT